MSYRFITDSAGVAAILPEIMEGEATWGNDSETTGLNPHKDKVILWSIGRADKQFVIDTRRASLEPLRPYFESKKHKKVLHNAKFDYKMLKGSFGIELEQARDTYLAEKILNVGRRKSGFALDDCLQIHLNVQMDKALQKSFIGHTGDFTGDQIRYAADDVAHLIPLCARQSRLIERDALQHAWLLECNAVPCFGDMEFDGVYLDKVKWRAIADENLAKAKALEVEMNEFAANFLPTNMFGEVDINYGSPPQVVKLFQRAGFKIKEELPNGGVLELSVTDSNDATLKRLQHYPFAKLLSKWRSYMIRVNTFGQPYIDAISPVTGRLHFQVHQMGTETGRPAKSGDSDVNLLNVPRDKAMRNCFHGAEDELVETSDFSGCELRIWAHLSKDPGLLEAFKRGEDLHCYVATKLYRKEVTKSNENKHLRTPTKALNFGIAYGMGPKKLHAKLNGEGFPIKMNECKELFYRYTKEEFKTGVEWLREMGRVGVRQGYLANDATGRRRWWQLPDHNNRDYYPKGEEDQKYLGRMAGIEREGGNFKIQSVNADITKLAMVKIRDYKKQHAVRTKFVNQVYDEIVTRTHKDDSPTWHPIKVKLMREAAEQFITSVPMEVESEALPYWTK